MNKFFGGASVSNYKSTPEQIIVAEMEQLWDTAMNMAVQHGYHPTNVIEQVIEARLLLYKKAGRLRQDEVTASDSPLPGESS